MSLVDAAHNAVAAVGLANSAFGSVKTALELAKKTSDRDLKNEIGSALDNVLELKVKVYELAEENRELRQLLEEKALITRESQSGFWFKKDETDPLCPKCYEASDKVIYLTHYGRSEFHGPHHTCKVCGFTHYDNRNS